MLHPGFFLIFINREEVSRCENHFLGPLSSFKHGRQDISIAKKETECGIAFEKFTDIKEGDQIQCFQISYEKATIDWVS